MDTMSPAELLQSTFLLQALLLRALHQRGIVSIEAIEEMLTETQLDATLQDVPGRVSDQVALKTLQFLAGMRDALPPFGH